ncbi:MAG: hypothetical protein ABSA11_10725 [Candidatus Bathyarchaeia archaeon]
MTSLTITYEESRCAECNEKLKDFMAYIPGKGEVCMNCWVKYMKLDENTPK